MSDHYDRLLAFQPDIYQRYAFLGGLTRALVGASADDVTILDVGCGPVRLTETFLGSRVRVVRADVEQFGDPEIVLIDPRHPLPFAAGEFDLVLALEVLEHVPNVERADFLRELQRIARVATIVCCPVSTTETVEAERDFFDAAKAISGKDIDFLREHRLYGLPVEAEVASWFDPAAQLLVTENAPLDDWLAFNLLDFIYAADFGDTEAKHQVDAALNAGARFRKSGVTHYRRFFCAVKAPDRAAAAARFIAQSGEGRSPTSLELMGRVMAAVLRLREDMRSVGAKERVRALEDVQSLVRQKDQRVTFLAAQVEGLGSTQAKSETEAAAREAELAATRRELADAQALLEGLRSTHAKSEAEAAVREAELAATRPELADAQALLEGLRSTQAKSEAEAAIREAELAATRRELADAQALLQTILHSRSWRLTGALRAMRRAFTRVTQAALRRAAVWMRNPGRLRRINKTEERTPIAAMAQTPNPQPSASPIRSFYVPPQGLLPWFNPLNVSIARHLSNEPRLNVLVPGLGMRHLSGGPNTALALAGRLALAGIPVRLMSTEAPLDGDREPLRTHIRGLIGAELPSGIELVDAHDRSTTIDIGDRDMFLATAWWTAQQAKYAVKLTKHQRFVYLIQDYEPLLHPASTQQALAAETYGLDHIPVINSEWLAEFLVQQRVGRFADADFVQPALVFQPAVDRAVFHPRERENVDGRRRLLFYARPTNGLRNLFELGVASLQKAIADGTLNPDEWEFLAMGEAMAPVPLGSRATLTPTPWLDLYGYARQMREADLLLSLMLSPHPSYPPLEMAASGGISVTTTFGNKSAEKLARISPNILGVEPTIERIAEGVAAAVRRLSDWPARIEGSRLHLPADWDSALSAVVPKLVDELVCIQGAPRRSDSRIAAVPVASSVAPAFQVWPHDEYEVYRLEAYARRLREYPAKGEDGLISFLTSVWNTDVRYLEELADSVVSQDSRASFEWVVLDNGSTDLATKGFLERLAAAEIVRYHRVEQNRGIVGGMRYCLERARNRYVSPLDSDDLLTPDCVRTVTHALRAAGFPALAFTDEDKLAEKRFCLPYLKPDWDPVLFANSAYIAHLGLIDREMALRLEAYTDPQAEGSHDWDTFTRFLLAGHKPLHIPEVLYSWRMHEGSTSGNIGSKSFIHHSQRSVVKKLVDGLAPGSRFRIELSPLFHGTPDWWIRREPRDPKPLTTVLIGGRPDETPRAAVPAEIAHEIVAVADDAPLAALSELITRCAEEQRLVHLLWTGTEPEDTHWYWEAVGLFELFPDTAIVGGRILRHGRVLSAASYFGFGRGCDSPDRGRAVHDPGYFAQMWKPHSASAVPVHHCVADASFFREFVLHYGNAKVSMRHLGAWLGAFARIRGRRVIYTPFLSARVTADLEASSDPVEWAAFRQVHAALMPERVCSSPWLGLTAATAYRGVTEEVRRAQLVAADSTDYSTALEADRNARAILYSGAPPPITFSLLTSVWARTPVRYFERMADSLRSQTWPFHQWIIFVNGPIPNTLEALVTSLARDQRVALVRHLDNVGRDLDNVGIIGGLRRAFERATGDFIMPMDHDDLLEPDALQVLAAAIAETQADLVYSDEDMVTEDTFVTPFRRPDFDPVLNFETSYIWHACAFRRERAARLEVYSDRGTEYCHDWDTLMRFTRAGASIAHVPHVLYHWRTHAASQSHSGAQNDGSVASTRYLLERVARKLPHPERYEVRRFPLYRGAEEWYIARLEEDSPKLALVYFTEDGRSWHKEEPALDTDFPFQRKLVISCAKGWGAALEEVADRVGPGTEYVAMMTELGYELLGRGWPWEAIRLLELHSDVAVVSGRVLDHRGTVLDTGKRTGRWAMAVNDFVALNRSDPGPFALALKPHSIDQPCEALLIVDVNFLQSAIDVARAEVPSTLGQLITTAARLHRRRIVYSPLIEVEIRQSADLSEQRSRICPAEATALSAAAP